MNLNKNMIISKIKEEYSFLREFFGVKKLYLFGSYIKNLQTKNSDIDFLVDFEKDRGNYKDELGLAIYLKKLFRKEVEVGKKSDLRPEYRKEIFKGGILEC